LYKKREVETAKKKKIWDMVEQIKMGIQHQAKKYNIPFRNTNK
jgi:hypothetical protein